jgi:hypothetical protein
MILITNGSEGFIPQTAKGSVVMTDLATDIATDGPAPSTNIEIALKNGAGSVQVDTSRLPDDVYREALMQGLKVIAERAMSKITKEAYPDDAQRKAAIKAKAEANVQDMYDGKTKITGQTKVKKAASGAIMTEAMRLARNLVKDAMKANKIKISHVKASEITAAAKTLIESDPTIVTTAEANLKAREATPIKIDIKALIHEDAGMVQKDEARRAKAKAEKPLSSKQASKIAPRATGAKPRPQVGA